MFSNLVKRLHLVGERDRPVEYDYDYLRVTDKQLEDLDLSDLNADEPALEAMGFQLFCIGLRDLIGDGYSNEDANKTWDDLPESSRRRYKLKVKIILMTGVLNHDGNHREDHSEDDPDL
jgi:hypothetical protein